MQHASIARRAAVAIAALCLVVSAAPTALAANTAAPTPSPTGQNCVTQANSARDKTPHAPVCFDTYAEEISYLTAGHVKLAATARSQDTTPDIQSTINEDSITYRASIVLSVEFKDYDFGGSTNTWTGTTACSGADAPFATSSMPSGWNNSIGSTKAYASCHAIHYDNGGATPSTAPGGALYSCTSTSACGHMGVMNDATSSMRWT